MSNSDVSRSQPFHLRFASMNLEQPVNGSPKVMPSMIPVVMPVIFVWIIANGVVTTIRIIATRVIAIRIIAI